MIKLCGISNKPAIPHFVFILLPFTTVFWSTHTAAMQNSTPSSISSWWETTTYNANGKQALFFALSKLYALIPLFCVAYIIYTRYFTGISHIPGPFSASISNFWKISAAWHQEMPKRNIALHRKYGPLVRIGPNMISVDDPAALSTIYGFKPIYLKARKDKIYMNRKLT